MRYRILAVILACLGIFCLEQQPRALTPAQMAVLFSGGCQQASTFIARTSLSGSDATNYTNLICGWVSGGIIDGNMSSTGCGSFLDGAWVLATKDTNTAVLNLCSSSFTLTPNNSPTFTAYRGYTGNGSNAFLGTGANPGGGGWTGHFSQNSAHWSHWNLTNTTSNQVFSGQDNGATSYQYFGGSMFARLNDSGGSETLANPQGHLISTRGSSSSRTTYFNGVSNATTSVASQAITNQNFAILWVGSQSGTATASQAAFYSIGGDIGSKITAFYTPLRAYMTAVGVP